MCKRLREFFKNRGKNKKDEELYLFAHEEDEEEGALEDGPLWNKDALTQLEGIVEGMSSWENAKAVEMDGRVGSGKSTVKRAFAKQLETKYPDSCVFVNFNAKLYGDYSEPLVMLLGRIWYGFKEFCNRPVNQEAYREAQKGIKKSRLKTDWKKLAVAGLEGIGALLKALELLSIPGISTAAAIVDVLLPFCKAAESFSGKKTNAIEDNGLFKNLKDYQSLTEIVIKLLNHFTNIEPGERAADPQEEPRPRQRKIVICIDELDQCDNSVRQAMLRQIDKLRGIHNCLFICALYEKDITGDGPDSCRAKASLANSFDLPPVQMDLDSRKCFQHHLDTLLSHHPELKLSEPEEKRILLQEIVLDMIAGHIDKEDELKNLKSELAGYLEKEKVLKEHLGAPGNNEEGTRCVIEECKLENKIKTLKTKIDKEADARINNILDNKNIARIIKMADEFLDTHALNETEDSRDSYLIIFLYLSFCKEYHNELYRKIFDMKELRTEVYDMAEYIKDDSLKALDEYPVKLAILDNPQNARRYVLKGGGEWDELIKANLFLSTWLTDPEHWPDDEIMKSDLTWDYDNYTGEPLTFENDEYDIMKYKSAIRRNVNTIFDAIKDLCVYRE